MTTAANVQIAYDDAGSGQPAVVLIHGLFEDRTYYAAQVRHLTESRRILNIDLRGHGASDVPENGYSLGVLADDVARICEKAGIRRAVFCGHSMAVALKVAVRRPELAAGVVLLDGAVLMPPAAVRRQIELVHALETDGWRDALLGFFGHVAGPAVERVRADISAAPRFYAAPLVRDIVACSEAHDDVRELAALSCPLLYVHSEIPTDLARLRELKPDAVIEEIAGAGHYLMLTAPERVNALLDRFLSGNQRSPVRQ